MSELPLWKKMFPVDRDAEARQARRAFLCTASVAGAGLTCASGLTPHGSETSGTERHPPQRLPFLLGDVPPGQARQFTFPDRRSPCLLIRTSSDHFVAYAQKCTHLACPVVPDLPAQELHCPCHHGTFALADGRPLSGPPRAPLARVVLEVADDGALTALGFEHTT